MPDVAEDVHVLPILGQYILYSPLRGICALINRVAVDALARVATGSLAPPSLSGELGDLASLVLTPPPSPPAYGQGQIRPCFLGIVSTRACNGACTYCGFGAPGAPSKMMDPGLAESAVDWMAEHVHLSGGDRLEVHLFGGEPFLAHEVVSRVVNRTFAQASRLGVVPHLEASTNGVHDEALMRWAGDHFSALVLSLDGPPDIHDRQRPVAGGRGSHAAAAHSARVLGATRAKLCLRASITRDSASRMGEIATWFSTNLEPSVVNFETIVYSDPSQAAEPADPFVFARGFAQAHAILDALGIEVVYAGYGTGSPRHTVCPVGRDAVIVSPDGEVNGCYLLPDRWRERGLDLTLGRATVEAGICVDPAAVERLRLLTLDKPRCQRCFCRWTCAGGCHVDVSYPGCNPTHTGYCAQTRVITAWRLLENMGCRSQGQALLSSAMAMETLSYRTSDRIQEWRGQ